MTNHKVIAGLSPVQAEKLDRMAQQNTSGNRAQFIRFILDKSWWLPGDYGLIPPSDADRAAVEEIERAAEAADHAIDPAVAHE